MQLSKYAPEETATEELKRNKFEKGLSLEIREKMAIKPSTYREVLETALRAEELMIERNEMEAKKKKPTGSFSAPIQTSGSSSFRGSSFQRGNLRGKGMSRFNQLRGGSFGRGFRGFEGRSGQGKSMSSLSIPLCTTCRRHHPG